MIKKSITKLSRSLAKLILPFFFKILINLKINRRVVNFLSEKGYHGNNKRNFVSQIQGLLHNNKIVALDVLSLLSKISISARKCKVGHLDNLTADFSHL